MVFPFTVRSKQSRLKKIKIRYPDIRWLDRVGATSIHEINTETIPTLNLSRGKRETVILIYWSPSFPIYIYILSFSFYARVGSVSNANKLSRYTGSRGEIETPRFSQYSRPTPCEI